MIGQARSTAPTSTGPAGESSLVRRALPAVAALFLLAHLAALPAAPDDIDAINFALGVRDFDVARHQPHPPGYPLFIALGKLATPVLRTAGVSSPEVRGLALWSALAGAGLLLVLVALWRTLDGDRWRPVLAALIAAASPLFWVTSLRPLSDLSGLCVAVGAMALILRGLPAPWTAATLRAPSIRALIAGAFLAGLAIGALAVGRLSVGRFSVGRSRVGKLVIDELEVNRLRVNELDVRETFQAPGGRSNEA